MNDENDRDRVKGDAVDYVRGDDVAQTLNEYG